MPLRASSAALYFRHFASVSALQQSIIFHISMILSEGPDICCAGSHIPVMLTSFPASCTILKIPKYKHTLMLHFAVLFINFWSSQSFPLEHHCCFCPRRHIFQLWNELLCGYHNLLNHVPVCLFYFWRCGCCALPSMFSQDCGENHRIFQASTSHALRCFTSRSTEPRYAPRDTLVWLDLHFTNLLE